MAKNPPPLHVVPNRTAAVPPPRPLGVHGTALWNRVLADYDIADVGGRELLALACEQLDRAVALREQIDQDGLVIKTRTGVLKDHPALRHELAARAFIAKTLLKLGLNVEPLHPGPGRPAGVWST
jgi:hypothetical protein